MGEAKRKRERLGAWYGKAVAPGHPDYVEPAPRLATGTLVERGDALDRSPAAGAFRIMALLAGASGGMLVAPLVGTGGRDG